MSESTPMRSGSLIERAATIYDFDAAFRARVGGEEAAPMPEAVSEIAAMTPRTEPALTPRIVIDRDVLGEQGLLVPGAPVSALAEEFRLIKRQLLLASRAIAAAHGARARAMMVCSANADEGKTYCAINLALSLAAERETEVVLIDADVAKPDVLKRLGVPERRGLLDAIADPDLDVEELIVATDIAQLSLLPAGTRSNEDTELLASGRTARIIAALLDANPRRVLVFDSPPVLAASPAATIALHVGQVMFVVRADKTPESDLREAIAMLDDCEQIHLVLNAVSLAPGGRRFGSYYGLEDA